VTASRRDFLKASAAAAAGTAVTAAGLLVPAPLLGASVPSTARLNAPVDPAMKALMETAMETAKASGASYADVRVSARRQQNVNTRDAIVQGVGDTDSFGLGVRTLVDGAWGFAATSVLTKDNVAAVTRRAIDQAKANRSSQLRPVVLAPTPACSSCAKKSR
jgi:TldD protein